MSRIPEGTYTGRAIAGSEQYGQTKPPNNYDQIVLDLELQELGEKVSTFLVFSDKSAPYAMQRLRACGWEGTDLSNLVGIDKNEVPVRVFYEEYQGKLTMKVEIVTAGGVVLAAPLDDKGKKMFAAKYAGLAKTTPAVVPMAVPVPRTAAPPVTRPAPIPMPEFQSTGSDDDIPF